MNKTDKQDLVTELQSEWRSVQSAFLLENKGIKVIDASRFRQGVRAAGGRYRVVKNTLASRAMDGTPLQPLTEHLRGPLGIVYTHKDPVALAKVLVEFTKDNPALVLKPAVVDGRKVDAKDVAVVATLPGRPELVGRLVGVLGSPVRRLAVALNTPVSQFVNVLNEIRKSKESAGAA